MNKVLLIGRLGAEPKTTTFENGKKVTKFSLATTEFFGEKKETTWHNIDIWGDYGVKMCSFIKKGSQIGVEGRISTNGYEKDGEHKVYTSIVCDKIELLDAKRPSEGAPDNGYNQSDVPSGNANPGNTFNTPQEQEDDLPF